jgi:hypothetical protein
MKALKLILNSSAWTVKLTESMNKSNSELESPRITTCMTLLDGRLIVVSPPSKFAGSVACTIPPWSSSTV